MGGKKKKKDEVSAVNWSFSKSKSRGDLVHFTGGGCGSSEKESALYSRELD